MKTMVAQQRLFLVLVLFLASCSLAASSCTVTETVYVERTSGSASQLVSTTELRQVQMTVTVTRNITSTIQGARTVTLTTAIYKPIFERSAPEIPHTYILNLEHSGMDLYDDGMPICFLCHFIPFEHEFWQNDAEICEQCHKESSHPAITPK